MGSTLSKPVRLIKNILLEKKRGAWVQVTGPHPRKHYSKSKLLTRTELDNSPVILEPKNTAPTNILRINF
jgi:hypothetical protein